MDTKACAVAHVEMFVAVVGLMILYYYVIISIDDQHLTEVLGI